MFQLTNEGEYGMHNNDWLSDMINCVSGNLDMELCLECHNCATIYMCCMIGVLWNLFKYQKPVAFALLVWRLVAGSEPPGGRVSK